MLRTQNLVPSVYYNHSRDFQVLGRAYDIILNYLKTNVNIIYSLPLSKNSDRRFLDLLCLTLGFKPKHHYDNNQLFAICTMFMTIMKNKGNIKALKYVVDILLQVQNIKKEAEISCLNNVITIILPEKINTSLLNDLLDYILPAGMSCEICIMNTISTTTRKTIVRQSDEIIKLGANVQSTPSKASDTSIIKGKFETGETLTPADLYAGRADNSTIVPYEGGQ